jgi:replicative superfamily II helicase
MSTLRSNGFIISKEGTVTYNPQYEPTTLGMATFRSSFSVEQALEVHEELQRAQLGLVLSDELHLLYLVTPLFSSLWLTAEQWSLYLKMLQKFEPSRLRVAEFVGVTERLLHFKAVEKTSSRDNKKVGLMGLAAALAATSLFVQDRPAVRFFLAMVLFEVIQEIPIAEVAHKYGIEKGFISQMMDMAAMFGSMMINFCRDLEFWALQILLVHFVKRVGMGIPRPWKHLSALSPDSVRAPAGVKSDIISLMDIPGVKAIRARAMYNAGFKSVRDVAAADAETMSVKLKKCFGPNATGIAKSIIRGAKVIIIARAEAMQKEAERLLAGSSSQITKVNSPAARLASVVEDFSRLIDATAKPDMQRTETDKWLAEHSYPGNGVAPERGFVGPFSLPP